MHVERLEIQGFKTFAQKTVLEFQPPKGKKTRGLTAIVGPNGSGKCLEGSSRVMLADGRYIAIRELYEEAERYTQNKEYWDDGSCVKDNPLGIQVLSLNPQTLKIEPRSVGAFVKRTSPSFLLKIKTRSGKVIRTTHYHPFFTLKDGQLHALKADGLKPGVVVSTPRSLPIETSQVALNVMDLLYSLEKRDSIYVPWNLSTQKALLALREEVGGTEELAYAARIPAQIIKSYSDGQSMHAYEYTSLARRLPEIEVLKSKGTGHMRLPKQLAPELARFLGYMISEGRVNENGHVWFVNEDKKMIEDFCAISKTCFGLQPSRFHYKETSEDVIINSTTLAIYLERQFGLKRDGTSFEKIVPNEMYRAPKQVVAAFLGALYEGDGHIANTSMEYATASKELAHGVSTLLLRFGIHSRINAKQKCATNTVRKIKRTYYSVYVYGSKQMKSFAQNIRFVGKKQKRLDRVLNTVRSSNPNVDLVPSSNTLVNQAVRTSQTPIKPLKKVCTKLEAYYRGTCSPSRDGLLEVARTIREYRRSPEGDETIERIETLATSDIFWDEIESVERITHEDWVYDLCIPETHNFISENFIIHNSNIADSVRWALGEQSLKMLRGKKSEDIIFSGSEGRTRAGFAEVSVHLNNEDHKAPIDYAQIVITRRLFRDGDSEYLLNGNAVRLADIHLMLAEANFGQRSYGVIGQGMIDHVLAAAPHERKEFFDDAAGVKSLQIKRHQAELKLDHSEDNLKQVQAILLELTPRLRALERQINRLHQRESLEQELVAVQRSYYGGVWHELETQRENVESKIKNQEEKLIERRKKVDEANAAFASMERAEETGGDLGKLQAEYQKLLKEKSRLDHEKFELERKIAIQQIWLEKPFVPLPLSKIIAEVDTLAREISSTLDALAAAKTLEEAKALTQPFSNSRERANKLLAGLQRPPVEEKPKEDPKMATELGAVESKIEDHLPKLREIESALANYSKNEQKKKGAFFELQRSVQAAQRELFDLERTQNELRVELARVETRRETTNEEMYSMLDEKLIAEIKSNQESRIRNQEELREKILDLKRKLEFIGGIEESVPQEYEETRARHDYLSTQSADLEAAISSTKKIMKELGAEIESRSEQALKILNREFEKYFKKIFGGGVARIVKVKEEVSEEDLALMSEEEKVARLSSARSGEGPRIYRTGIDIQATPPGKRLKAINLLSGGERSMTAIALIAAIIAMNPSPFVVLDEVDAALDEANTKRFAEILLELAAKTQFIVITHNRTTMEAADTLYGVTMGSDGVSKMLSVRLKDVKAFARQ